MNAAPETQTIAGDPLWRCAHPVEPARDANWHYRPGFFRGAVGISPMPADHRDPEHGRGDLDDPGLDAASLLLERALPYRFDELPAVVATVHPVTHARIEAGSLSSNSGVTTADPPGIYLTVTRPPATAEALVHEMAHHKLFAIGVTTETGGGVIEDGDMLAYSAAVERDRPIPAILHASYSFLHMVEFNIACRRARLFEPETDALLRGNLRVSHDTLAQLRRHARPTPAGTYFLDRFYRWADTLLSSSEAL